MKRRVFLTKGAAGAFTLGVVGCSKNDPVNPLSSPGNTFISGMIADPEGNGVQSVKVTLAGGLENNSVYTNKMGEFSIEVPQNGEYTIYPSKHGYKFNPISQKITVNNSQSFVVNIMAFLVNSTSGGLTTRELGKTGIMVSNFGLGSHLLGENKNNSNYAIEREHMVREMFDHGITAFDIYDNEQSCYQYEPMGKYLAPVIHEAVISISIRPYSGRSLEEQLERDLRVFGRDYIDMVRCHAWYPGYNKSDGKWEWWEDLFKFKEQGKIRAVGVPIHQLSDLEEPLAAYPLDYVFFPYNFYYNVGWPPELRPEGFIPLAQSLREQGIGVATIKPFAGDYFVQTLRETAAGINPDLSLNQAALRYVLNSGLEPDTTFAGMNHFGEFLDNMQAYYEPDISDDEQALLEEVKTVAEKKAHTVLPEHYRFLDQWAPKPDENTEIKFA